MRRILVTGANKGIGLAIVEAILGHRDVRGSDDTFVFLGTRDERRGHEAAAKLVATNPAWKSRLEVVNLDVSSDASVTAAAQRVARSLGSEKLYGIVNNAGLGQGNSLSDILQVNALGIHRTCEAFIPLLDPKGGRIVNVTSAAGPSFVASCSPEMQRFFLDPSSSWSEIASFIDQCIAMSGNAEAFKAKGLGDGAAYGLSKAIANKYTLTLAREHANLRINACTPGFIETDMTRHYAQSQGKSPAELGMKTPADGAKSALHLLFADLEGNGWYYGSDAQRSPLDRYRSPGSPAYTGD